MTTPATPAYDGLSSQGQSFGITNAYKITIRQSRGSTSSSKNDVSTLSIPNGGNRVYEDGLPDGGPDGDGITVTATVNTRGAPPPTGDIKTFGGKSCKCVESETVDDAGRPSEGVANYTSDYPKDQQA